jgi:superoxide dismutase, Cu-Zn family
MKKILFPLALALLATPASSEILGIGKDKATATIIDAKGLVVGNAKVVSSKKHGLRIAIVVKGMAPGEHGVHLHSIGLCEGPKFVSAGPHWNPQNKMHGRDSQMGSHAGDLPNLYIDRKGRGKLTFDIADGRFDRAGGLLDDDGGSIVIHALSDDQRTDPSGNSGDRIACGVFR